MKFWPLLLTSTLTVIVIGLSCGINDSIEPIVDGGSGTETIGILVDAQNKPVANAQVLIASASDTTLRYKDTTNGTGGFKIDTTNPGKYYLFGFTKDTSLAILDTFVKDSGKQKNLGRLTMKEPGAIEGTVLVDGETKLGVLIYIPGTSWAAKSDSAGNFCMTSVAVGEYSLSFEYGIFIAARTKIMVAANDTTKLPDTVNLLPDTNQPPPAPKWLYPQYDTASGVVLLHWPKNSAVDCKDYIVYKHDSTGNPQKIGDTKDTFYSNNLVFDPLDTNCYKLTYQITARDKQNNESKFSPLCSPTVVPPSFVTTKFKWTSDTATINKKVKIHVHYYNRTRKNASIKWYVDTISDPVKDTVVDTKEGIDTLYYTWNDTGTHVVTFVAIDETGCQWIGTRTINVTTGVIINPNTWDTLPSLKHPRKLAGTAVIGNTVYCVGGASVSGGQKTRGETSVAFCEYYSQKDSLWKDFKEKLATARHSATLSAVSGSLYLIGGKYNGTSSTNISIDSILKYDVQNEKWTNFCKAPWVRFAHAACVVGDSIYIIGGIITIGGSGPEYPKQIEVFDPKTQSWSLKGEIITPRYNHQVVLVNNKIYIIGGEVEGGSVIDDIEIYDVITQKSTVAHTRLNTPRRNFGAAAIGDSIFIFGGVQSSDLSGITAKVEYYDITKDLWIERKAMPKAIWGFGIAVQSHSFIIIGGNISENVSVGNCYRYNP